LPLEDLEFSVGNTMKGEQLFYVLESKDKQTYLAASFTADPIEYRWKDGAYAYAAMAIADASMFVIVGEGFRPGEQLLTISQTCSEIVSGILEADADGKAYSILMPSLVKVKGATGKFTIRRQHSEELGTLDYLWGSRARESIKFRENKRPQSANF